MFKSHEELPLRASELQLCFYCSSPLPASTGEHIFNASWGGSHQTKRLICDNCNAEFGKSIDTSFKIYTDIVMNAYSFKGKRLKAIPPIQLEGNYFLDAGGKPKLKKPLVQKETQADGLIRANISFNSPEEGKQWVKGSGAESWLGRPLKEEEKEYLRKKIIEAPYQSEYLQPQDASAKLDLRSQYRSAAHTVLKCLGFFIPEWVCDNQTKQVRQFARYNESDWLLFAVHAEQHLSLADEVVKLLGLGVKHNSVEIYWCSYLRMVIGVVTILSRVKRSVVIAKDYSGPDKILYVFEDTNGSSKAPRAISVEINPQKFSLPIIPIIGIQHFASPTRTYQFFQNELSSFANTYYPIDCLTAKLIRTIDEVNQTSVEVDENLLEKYKQAFIECFTNLIKIQGQSIDLDKLLAKMSDYGFATLAGKFAGKKCDDIDFNSSISKIFESLMNEFTQGYFL
jgi:hypothetical protein